MSNIYIEVYWLSGMETYSYTAIPFSNYQSLPRLMSLSNIIYNIRFDGEIENQTVTITLSNHDRYFDTKMTDDPFIIERTVKIKNSTMTLFTGLVREMPDFSDENVLTLKIDIFSLIDREINRRITIGEFPNCPPENLGKAANYVYGNADTYPKTLTAYRIDTGKFLAARHMVDSLNPVYDGDTEITDYSVLWDSQTNNEYIICNSTALELQFSCTQSVPTPIPEYPWQPTPKYNPVKMLQMFLELVESPIQINAANYEIAKQRLDDRGHTGNLVIAGVTTIKDLLSQFAQSYHCFIYINTDLEIIIKFIEYNIIPNTKIHPTYIKNFQKKIDSSYVAGSFVRKYHYLHASGEFQQTPADVIPVAPYNTKKNEIIQKFIIDDVTSWDLAHRIRYIFEKPLLYVSFEIPKSISDQLTPGDYVYIKHHKHFFPEEYRKILIMRKVSNRKKVLDTIEGFDFSHIEMNVFKICTVSDPELNYIYGEGNPANHVIGWVK